MDTIHVSRKLEISGNSWVCKNAGLLWYISGSTGCLRSHPWLMPQTPRPRDYSRIRDVFLPLLTGGMLCICTDDSHSLKVAAGGHLSIFTIAFMIICRKVNHATDNYLSLNTVNDLTLNEPKPTLKYPWIHLGVANVSGLVVSICQEPILIPLQCLLERPQWFYSTTLNSIHLSEWEAVLLMTSCFHWALCSHAGLLS